jgi:preprotein translocase SecF subunit
VFHLTRYRYIFFAISGAIIVPGLLALIFWHLNLGIDFTNGSTATLRFQNGSTIANVSQAFTKAKAQDVNVLISTDTTNANQIVYLQFSRPIGKSFETSVMNLLAAKGANLPASTELHVDYISALDNNQAGLMVVQFAKGVKVADVRAALKTLPQTDAPPVGVTSQSFQATPTPNATGTVAPTNTPAPTATAAPTGTAKATTTPSATATPAPTAQTFPVTLTGVNLAANNQLFQVETQTDLASTPQQCSADKNKACLDNIVGSLEQQYGPVYVVQSSSVGPAIASETTLFAILAVIAASLFIMVYIGIAFRRVGSIGLAFRFGASAIIALLHDAFVVLGLWAIFGHFFNFKVDSLFVTAVLTVIGFSVHDTIVVFDRIRENMGRHTSETFDTVVDTSLIQTLSRSLNTSLTVLVVLSAEALFGGASTREFVLALLIGIASGTYSSIFNASMILAVWQNEEYKHWFHRDDRAAMQLAGAPRRTPAGVR